MADCAARGIDYLPCVMPGDLAGGHRKHGDFYWRHIYNMVRLGSQGLYVSMFDEYNEGNQIAKTSETQATTPAGANIRALDEDGVACSSDYYLRITADGGRMLKGQLALTAVRPTPPMVGTPPPDRRRTWPPAGPPRRAARAAGSRRRTRWTPNAGSYWESGGGAFPHWWQVDLGASHQVNKLVLRLPAGWGARTQTITVQGSVDGSSFATIAGASAFAFDPATGNTVTRTLTTTTARYVRLSIGGNTGWPAAQLAQVEVYAGSTTPDNPPTAPSGLTVTGKTSTSVSLAWTASTDDTGVTGYQVRQGGTVVATVTGTTATVSGLNPSTAYTFTVIARDAAGNTSGASNTVTVTTDAATNADLARGRPTSESSHVQSYGSGNVVDGDPNSYWESANNAFPQWVPGRPGFVAHGRAGGAQAAAGHRLGQPDADPLRAGQHRRRQLQHAGRLGGADLQPGHRQPGDASPSPPRRPGTCASRSPATPAGRPGNCRPWRSTRADPTSRATAGGAVVVLLGSSGSGSSGLGRPARVVRLGSSAPVVRLGSLGGPGPQSDRRVWGGATI